MSTPQSDHPRTWSEGRRLRAWELHLQGWNQRRIAQALGVSPAAVSQWLQRGTADGVEALRAHPPPGRPPPLSPAQLRQLPDLLAPGAEAFGFRGAVWTRRRVAQVIAQHFGIRYHPRHVGRLLEQTGWTPQKPIVRASQRDAAAIAAWQQERWPAIKKKPHTNGAPSSG
ncbi:MAG: IS630 family transposase [Actinomycetota bacterium]|nr:IS630 family transposase [Actinomycetota bacterium]